MSVASSAMDRAGQALAGISRFRAARWAAVFAALALALLPIVNIVTIIATTGANNLCSDYAVVVPFMSEILDGGYNWTHYFADSFYRAHCMAVSDLAIVAVARLTNWNEFAELYTTVFICIVRVVLLHSILGRFTGARLRWVLWPALSALVFSTSQLTNFTFGLSAIQINLALLGIELGLWGLLRFPRSRLGVAIMVIGGIVASWSWGVGVVSWPIFLIALWLLDFRRVWHYGTWLAAAVLAFLPYVNSAAVSSWSRDKIDAGSSYFLTYFVNVVGRPLAGEVGVNFGPLPAAERIAWVGLILFVLGLIILWRGPRSRIERFVPALLISLVGLVGSLEISVTRNSGVTIAPWYTNTAMLFWIGLVGLAFTVWTEVWALSPRDRRLHSAQFAFCSLWSLAVIASVAVAYLTSNLTYLDKSFFLRLRSPASAACLRSYRTAPTICAGLLSYPDGVETAVHARMAQALEQRHLSVFAPHQEWTLQGDYVLEAVQPEQAPGAPPIAWYVDLAGERAAWSDVRHLNLRLAASNAISWRVEIPSNARQVEFRSAVAIGAPAVDRADDAGATFEVDVEPAGGPPQPALVRQVGAWQHTWLPIHMPLSRYRGQTITLRLKVSAAQTGGAADWAMYRYPAIDLELEKEPVDVSEASAPIVISSNTELSPAAPQPQATDLRLDGADPTLWQATDLQAGVGAPGTWVAGPNPMLVPREPIDVALADYTHLYLRLAASPDIRPRACRVFYQLHSGESGSRQPLEMAMIPILIDGAVHSYLYDLKLMVAGANPGSELNIVRIDPVISGNPGGESRVQFVELGFITREGRHPPTTVSPVIPPEAIVGELTRDVTVSQNFAAQCRGLQQVGLMVGTYARTNTHPVVVHVADEAAGRVIAERSIPGEKIPDNEWISIEFEPQLDSQGKTYVVTVLSPDSVRHNAITLYRSKSDVYPLGQASIGGKPIQADLTFRYRCAN